MTREEARVYIIRHCNPDYPNGKTERETAINMAIEALSREPSVHESVKDAQTGRWIKAIDELGEAWSCSECLTEYTVDNMDEFVEYAKFCPNCGARMQP